MTRKQPDLFQIDVQPELLEDQPTQAFRPDPDSVRMRLHNILAEARAANVLPWEHSKVSLYRTIFPQMSQWLPDEEAAQLRFEFETEMERLNAA